MWRFNKNKLTIVPILKLVPIKKSKIEYNYSIGDLVQSCVTCNMYKYDTLDLNTIYNA